jgi:multidrug efflux system outer membrane protein
MRNSNKLLFVLLSLILAGCHLGPDYHLPKVTTPVQWKTEEAPLPAPQLSYWWEVFEDDFLSDLEHKAIKNNPTLYVALERVIEARALANVSRANLFPQVNLNPSYYNTMFLAKFQAPDTTVAQTQNIKPFENQLFRIHNITYALPLDLSYQLDLWGTYRGQYDSALYTAQAEAEAYCVSLLTLTTDLASAYYQLRALDAQLDMLQSTIKVRKDAYEVNQARWDAGLVNYTDVSRAALEFTNAEGQYFDAQRQRNIQENRIAVLIGEPASLFGIKHDSLKMSPPQIPASLPATVLLQRPDVARAEREMAAQHALIGVAYAAFLPQISLTGALGYQSPQLNAFLSARSRLWAIGANASQPILDGGRNIANLDATWARFLETTGTYQNQVLIAFQEVEDALSNIEWQAKQYASLQKSVTSAKLTTELSSERYKKGLVNYLDVVDSERAELEVEITAINLLGQRYLSTIQLIKAIGGGWADCQDL